MKKPQNLFLFFMTVLLCACAGTFSAQEKSEAQRAIAANPCVNQFYTGPAADFNPSQDSQTYFPNDACAIALQNLETRELAYCYSNPDSTAESCAGFYEKQGFIRLREIPYKTANYDFLKVDTYPTRRWRDAEITSRW